MAALDKQIIALHKIFDGLAKEHLPFEIIEADLIALIQSFNAIYIDKIQNERQKLNIALEQNIELRELNLHKLKSSKYELSEIKNNLQKVSDNIALIHTLLSTIAQIEAYTYNILLEREVLITLNQEQKKEQIALLLHKSTIKLDSMWDTYSLFYQELNACKILV